MGSRYVEVSLEVLLGALATAGEEVVMPEWMESAIWAGDLDTLEERAGCICCCDEHTFATCPARLWEGCRGTGAMTQADVKSWELHYERFHGLSRDQFYGGVS